MLAYMGNWTIEIVPQGDKVAVRLDTSPPGLKPFMTIQDLSIPGALVAEFTGHWDYGAQPIVRFIREKLLRDLGPQWPLVQYNNWYDVKEKFTELHVIEAARAAAAVGLHHRCLAGAVGRAVAGAVPQSPRGFLRARRLGWLVGGRAAGTAVDDRRVGRTARHRAVDRLRLDDDRAGPDLDADGEVSPG